MLLFPFLPFLLLPGSLKLPPFLLCFSSFPGFICHSLVYDSKKPNLKSSVKFIGLGLAPLVSFASPAGVALHKRPPCMSHLNSNSLFFKMLEQKNPASSIVQGQEDYENTFKNRFQLKVFLIIQLA